MSKQNTKAALPDLNSEAKRNSVESDDDKSEEVKFASAGVIALSCESDIAGDFRIYSITSDVPEPATMSLVGLVGVMLLRRKRK